MNTKKMSDYIEDLHWGNPEEVQKNAIKVLIEIPENEFPSNLITGTEKECWYNVLEIYKRIGYPRIMNEVVQLLFLFKDMNWPGAGEASDLLKSINHDEILLYLKEALQQADNENDTLWITWIKEFIKEINLKDEFKDFEGILIRAEW
jgi:hypothetical protein